MEQGRLTAVLGRMQQLQAHLAALVGLWQLASLGVPLVGWVCPWVLELVQVGLVLKCCWQVGQQPQVVPLAVCQEWMWSLFHCLSQPWT